MIGELVSMNYFRYLTLSYLFVVLLAHESIAEVNANPQPRLVVKDAVFDFGSVEQGELVEHSFIVENQGEAPLDIKRIVPSCGCSLADLEKNLVEPHAKTTIKTSFDTSGFWGSKVKTFRIYSNDQTSPSFLLTVQGEVKRDVTVNPPRLYFGDVQKGASLKRAATITVGAKSSIDLLEVISHSNFLEVSDQDINDRGRKGKRISVELKGDLPIGIFRDRVVVKTSSEKNPVITLPVFARIKGDLTVEPAEVSFGLVENGAIESLSKVVRLANSSSQNIKILSIESEPPSIETAVKVIRPGKELEITIRISKDTSSVVRGKVTIKTDHPDPDQQNVTIPIYGIVSNKGD